MQHPAGGHSLLSGAGRSSKAAGGRRGALASQSATSGNACIRDTLAVPAHIADPAMAANVAPRPFRHGPCAWPGRHACASYGPPSRGHHLEVTPAKDDEIPACLPSEARPAVPPHRGRCGTAGDIRFSHPSVEVDLSLLVFAAPPAGPGLPRSSSPLSPRPTFSLTPSTAPLVFDLAPPSVMPSGGSGTPFESPLSAMLGGRRPRRSADRCRRWRSRSARRW